MKDGADLIWLKFKEGDEEAFLELYRMHYLGLINYGIKLTGDREIANECLTNMLMQLWDSRLKLPEVTNVRAYLITCLKRVAFSHFKSVQTRRIKEGKAVDLMEEGLSQADYFEVIQNNSILRSALLKAMEVLTEREKELIKLKFFDDLDYDEIAEKCGITKRTAYNITHDALKKLRDSLKEKNGEDYYSLLCIVIFLTLYLK